MTTLTLLHPGSIGAAIGGEAARAGTRVLWVPTGRSEATRQRAQTAGLQPAAPLEAALAVSDLVLSIAPAHLAEEVAATVAPFDYTGLYVEANPTPPATLERITAQLPHATVLDAAIFGPDADRTRAAALYLHGPEPEVALLRTLFANTRVHTHTLPHPPPIGRASALKIAYLTYQRTTRTLTALTHALATHHGVQHELLAEAAHMPTPRLDDTAFLPTLATRAWRWHHELDIAATALTAANLPPALAQATAELLTTWDKDKDNRSLEAEDVINRLLNGSGRGRTPLGESHRERAGARQQQRYLTE
ncbi:DUF1932 domain-containing protein [Streptomyces triticirhizae]|uniref:DUF1932 domain-containing protein n=1 Tax=Streptomyces triticirhizae TaxID=2483353 RepID=A0A3M2M8Q5_9ACTN|nr:DUF1932 domain-containing protein [Streptomyces triticirhizae]RMI45223.1 DUF1932 domain-containing protein [Streptomyces triticirhizae]